MLFNFLRLLLLIVPIMNISNSVTGIPCYSNSRGNLTISSGFGLCVMSMGMEQKGDFYGKKNIEFEGKISFCFKQEMLFDGHTPTEGWKEFAMRGHRLAPTIPQYNQIIEDSLEENDYDRLF